MLEIYQNLLWFFKREKKSYLVLFVQLIIIAFLVTIPPKLVGSIIDLIASKQLNSSNLMIQGGLLIAIPFIIYLFNYTFNKGMFFKGQKLSAELRVNYLHKLFNADAKIYEEYDKGDLIARVSDDMLSITQAATSLLTDLVYCSSLIIFVMFNMIFTISFKLTIIGFGIVPIGFLLLNKWRQHMRKYYETHRKVYAKFFDSILESIEGMRVVRAYVMEDDDYQKNEVRIEDDITSWTKIVRFENLFGPLFSTTMALATFLTFSYGSYLIITSQILPGELITFYMYITMIAGPINVLANIMNVVNQAHIGQKRYYEIINLENDVVEKDDSKSILFFQKLKYENVSFKYPFDQDYVLQDLNIEISKGQTIGIVGPTGSGKSTFIRQLIRDFNVTKGSIYLNDHDIEEYKINDVRNLVGYVPQVHTLFKGSVKENLELSLENPNISDYNQLSSAINAAYFEKDIEYMSDGLMTRIGENGNGLSGGQKQRLSIARALLKKPQILILDDSLSAVDAKTERAIVDNIKATREHMTNIIITHRFSVVKNADKIYVFKDGKIDEVGNHEELLQNKKWYYEQYQNQIRGSEYERI